MVSLKNYRQNFQFLLFMFFVFAGSHKDTGFSSMPWTVPDDQANYAICNCKHTKNPPFCDGTHTTLPEMVNGRQKVCKKKDKHNKECKLCTNCGWVPEF